MNSNMIIKEMLPDEFKTTKNKQITYGISKTRFGDCLVALYEDQVCYLGFCGENYGNKALDCLNSEWSACTITRDDKKLKPIIENIFQEGGDSKRIKVLLHGTEFQISVWKELAKLAVGKTVTYSQVAEAIGKPKAVRAVANAVARNRVPYLIPCHRVMHKGGVLNKFGWGVQMKTDMLEYEAKLL